MNFAREAVHYWILADQKEQLANQVGEELKARHGVKIAHPIRDEALALQRHYLRKAHAAAAIASALGHRWDEQQGSWIGRIKIGREHD